MSPIRPEWQYVAVRVSPRKEISNVASLMCHPAQCMFYCTLLLDVQQTWNSTTVLKKTVTQSKYSASFSPALIFLTTTCEGGKHKYHIQRV